MANERLREHARIKNVRLWELSARLGYKTDGTLCRKLRYQLEEETENEYIRLVDEIASEKRSSAAVSN